MHAPDAAAIAGQLADEDRRLVFAAVVLGATTVEEVLARTGLAAAAGAKALGRLVDAGMVRTDEGGALVVATDALVQAARAALSRPPSTEHAAAPPEAAKVLRAFVQDGRLLRIPTAGAKRRVVLDWLAQDFEPGRHYKEGMVNLILGKRHADTAALRRHMVDGGYLDREDGWYWRAGGTVAGTDGA
jgi:hypothetical protein